MKKIKIFNLILFTIVLYFTFGCYEDRGSDVYTKINEVVIDRIFNKDGEVGDKDSVFSVITNYNDTLKINPVINLNTEEVFIPENYNFSWKIDSGSEVIEISTQRNLVYPIDIPIGSYRVYLFVTEKSTNIRYHQSFAVSVNNLYSNGLFVLTENSDNYGELDMVSYLPSDTLLFHNILASSNAPKYKNPFGLYKGVYRMNNEIHILSEGGTYLINPTDFSFKKGLDEIKYKMMAPTTLWSKGEVKSIFDPTGAMRVSIIDDNVYYGEPYDGMIYGYPINSYPDSLSLFKCAPIFAGSYKKTSRYGFQVVVYDLVLKRFVYATNSSKGFRFLTNTKLDLDIFDWTTGLNFVTSFHSFFGTNGESTSILTDNKDKYYAYRYSVPASGTITKTARYDISDAPDLSKATMFFASATQPYIFYVVGSNIHGYDLANGKKYCYSKDIGAEITAIYDAPTSSVERGKDFIYIATYGGTLGSGKITKLHIVDDPNKVELEYVLHGDKPVVWTGFNKITAMTFK